MSSTVLIAVVVVLLIVGYRAIKRKSTLSLSATDRRFAKESTHEGLRCLGYATATNLDDDAEAYRVGYERCSRDGAAALLVVSLVSSGMCAHYSLRKKRDAAFCDQLMLLSNELIAAEFEANATELWDNRNELFALNSNAKLVVELVPHS